MKLLSRQQAESFYGSINENFIQVCSFLSPNNDIREVIAFLVSDKEQNVMTNDNLSIHVESGNIFYQNFIMNGNFYSFLEAQQDKIKAIIPKRISYHNSFGKYINKYLPSFSIDDAEKFDLFANKNLKYLFYKFNDKIEALGREKRNIRYTAKMKDSISLKKIEERDRQFLLEKIVHSIEFSNPYESPIEKKPEIIAFVESNYKISRRVYQALFIDIGDSFIKYIHSLDIKEIQELDDDLKANGWGVKSLLEVENALELLTVFHVF